MDRKAGWKEYAVSALLVLAVIIGFFMIKLRVIPLPEDYDVLVISGRTFIPAIAVGIAAAAVFLVIRKPGLLLTVAITAIFCSFMCFGDMFSALYVFAALCLLGTIPFVASLIANLRHVAIEDAA